MSEDHSADRARLLDMEDYAKPRKIPAGKSLSDYRRMPGCMSIKITDNGFSGR
jgi:hypothetical protein